MKTIARKSVYCLESVMPKTAKTDDTMYDKSDLDEIRCHREFIGIYDSVSKAEYDMMTLIDANEKIIKEYDVGFRYFCFVIIERYLNDAIDEYGNISYFESQRVYLGNGQLNCVSDYDYRCIKTFNGRDESIKNLKPNDFCWILNKNILVPAVIIDCPPTKDELNKRFKNGFNGDFTDDSGTVVTIDCGHHHSLAVNMFPIDLLEFYKMSDNIKNKLIKEKEDYLNKF